jgi:hypothetical protein
MFDHAVGAREGRQPLDTQYCNMGTTFVFAFHRLKNSPTWMYRRLSAGCSCFLSGFVKCDRRRTIRASARTLV